MPNVRYVNPGATVDLVVLKEGKLLLIKRKHEPFKDMYALPGGFLEYKKETLEQAGARELFEETSLVAKIDDLVLLGAYSELNRDPRDHVISHVYYVKKYEGTLMPNDDAADAEWFDIDNLPELAFDHRKIICECLPKINNLH